MTMKIGSLLFVYGTLRPGEGADLNHKGGDAVRHLGTDQITGRIYNLGSYPGVIAEPSPFNPGDDHVIGDVFEILDESIIPRLDAYEGYRPDGSGLYNRIETKTAEGRTVWVYTYNHRVTEEMRIMSGDWRDSTAAMNTPRQTPSAE